MKSLVTVLLCCLFNCALKAQLSNGSIAPNWTLTDIDGKSHTLYNSLDNGKAVVLDFSAAYCPICWAYHNSNALSNFYNSRGPSATNHQADVFFIEVLANNSKGCLYGPSGGGTPFTACTGSGSAGNWVANTPYPIIDNASLNSLYSINFYPTIYMVCPNKTVYLVGQQNAAQLDNSMQTYCGIVPGGSVATPLSYSTSNVKNNPCFGDKKGSATIIASGGTPPYTYKWNNGQTTATINNLAAGNYVATITDSKSKTLTISQLTITQGVEIKATSSQVKYEKCGKTGEITLSQSGGTGAFSYLWSNNATTKSIQNLTSSGPYSVTLTDALGCKSNIANIVLEGYENQPKATLNSTLQLNCAIQSGELKGSVVPLSNDYTYAWTSSNGGNITSQNNVNATVNATGTYTLKVTDLLSKCTSSVSVTVTANTTIPKIVFEPTTDKVLHCNKKEITLSPKITDSGVDAIYNWSSQNGGVFVGNTNTAVAKINAKGNYKLEVINSANNCKSDNFIEITEAVKPVLDIVKIDKIKCFGDKTGKLTSNVGATQAPVTYIWSNNASTADIDKLPAGNYSLTISDAFGCSTSSLATITQPLALDLKVTKIVNATGTNSNGSIDISILGGTKPYTFSWKKDNILLPIISEDLTNIQSGNYEVLVEDANNCIIKIDKIIVQKLVGIEDVNGLIDYKCYPNPTNDVLNVSLKLIDSQLISADLVDAFGKVVLSKNLISTSFYQEQFDLSNLPIAVYFLHLKIGKTELVEKIVKY
jgi:hypothetical protein